MSDPRQAQVWGKKSEVADRTLNERKYCKVCDYYYSELFTCPICYGADRERERIVKLFKPYSYHDEMCYYEGKRICYPEDCSAEMYSSVIREILKTDNQENLHEL